MRRILCLFLPLMLCVSACLGEGATFAGTWYLHTLDIDGVEVNVADIGYRMTLTIRADGTYTTSVGDGQQASGQWALTDDGLRLNPGTEGGLTLAVDGSALTTDLNGSPATFLRTKPAATPVGTAIDAAWEDFLGSWELTGVWADGGYLPAMFYGIEDAVIIAFDEDGSVRYAHDGITESLEAAWIEGEVYVRSAADEMYFHMLDDGTLMLRLEAQASGAPEMIFARAPAVK